MSEETTQVTAPTTPKGTSSLTNWGHLLLWSGVILCIVAFFIMKTDIEGTTNLSLQQNQTLTMMTGLFAAATGAIIVALGEIHITVRRWAVWSGFGKPPTE